MPPESRSMNDSYAIPLSALEHFEYCPRQCAFIHVDQLWRDNVHTVRGQYGHRRADNAPPSIGRGVRTLRAVELWSDRLNVIGRADVVEVHPNGSLVPIEYKIGILHRDAASVQLCAQALCLEEMTATSIPYGYVWTAADRRRTRIAFDADLRARTIARIAEVAALLRESVLPPAPDDQRCPECQFLPVCLPGVVSHASQVEQFEHEVLFKCAS